MIRSWNVSTKSRSIRDWILAVAFVFLAGCAVAVASQRGESGPTFTVTPPAGDWTLIAYGDMRFTDPANRGVSDPIARQALVQKIAEEKPDVLLITGDLPHQGGEANDYAVYQQETEPWRKAGIRVFPALGNHELYDPRDRNACNSCLENWWNAFPELRGRRWYSIRFGEAYIITLDSTLELTAGAVQSRWLARQLKELPEGVRYVFISLHHPPITDSVPGMESHDARPNEQALARQLEAAAKQMRAKIVVIAGHIHNYERFRRRGVDYLVSGGGGATPYRVLRTFRDLYPHNFFPNYHYVKFARDGDKLKATTYRLDGDSFSPVDRFTVDGKAAGKRSRNVRKRFDSAVGIR
jgi:3',5'-cyclic AMP phosphodiesterase CpdA